jgi:hypothetical protein
MSTLLTPPFPETPRDLVFQADHQSLLWGRSPTILGSKQLGLRQEVFHRRQNLFGSMAIAEGIDRIGHCCIGLTACLGFLGDKPLQERGILTWTSRLKVGYDSLLVN